MLESLTTFMDTRQEKWLQDWYLLPTSGCPFEHHHSFPWEIIWRSKALMRVAFFDNWQLKVEEGKDYRLVLYVQMQWWICWSPFATLLYCFRLMVHDIGFVWRVVELLACWQGQFCNHQNSHIWIVIHHCLMCCFWREKNSRSFEDTESSMPNLKLFFFRTLLDWL